MKSFALVFAGLMLAAFVSTSRADELPTGIAFVPDPPPGISGDLERFKTVPGWQPLEEVAYGSEQWTGAADASGETVVAWDYQYLYIAARVKDDAVRQPYFGGELWKGDHVVLLLDLPRQPAGARDKTKIIQIGLSPGNGDNVPAEVYQWSPAPPRSIPGARIASTITPQGYQLEAALPWAALGVERPEEGQAIGVDVVISDADESQAAQQSLVSLLPAPWVLRDPDRLVEMALAGSDAKVDPSKLQSTFEPVGELFRVESGKSATVEVGPSEVGDVQELVVRARMESRKIAGGTSGMQVFLNGQELTPEHVRNRLERFQMGTMSLGTYTNRGWFTIYAPSFEPADPYSSYAVQGINPYEWRFDVTRLWKPGQANTVEVRHTRGGVVPNELVVELGVSEQLTPKLTPPPLAPAPTGELATVTPAGPARPDYQYRTLPGGAIEVSLGGRTWVVTSDYSTLTPGWARLSEQPAGDEWRQLQTGADGVTAQARDFRLERTLTRHDDHLQVVDRLTNLTDADLPVMLRHAAELGEGVEQVYVAGLPVDSLTYYIDVGGAPTSMAVYDDKSLGFVSEDDVLRAQGQTFVDKGVIGINNRHLVLTPGRTIELEFSVYPLDSADPFAFINGIRRNWGTNFTLEGSFAFAGLRLPLFGATDDAMRTYLHNKSAHFLSSTIPVYKPGVYAHGTALFNSTRIEDYQKFNQHVKRVAPDTETLLYFHCYISVSEDDAAKYPDAILRRPDGSHADYRSAKYPLFIPRAGNDFAKVQDELIDFRFDTIGVDGIYWDEMDYSAFKYDYSDAYWDGVSAQIDPRTHQITRKISNVPLATQEWRRQATLRILDRGPLVANGQPETRTMTQIHFPRFVETGSISNLAKAQLYTPIALGDHLTERNAVDCYENMLRALDYGGLYYWYTDQIVAPYPTLTQHMFPTTPIELGRGYIIAEERILTNRSGLFGWGDDSQFEAHVYDRTGRLTDEIKVPRIERDGKAYAEVRIPEGYAVALIRQP